MGTIGLICLVGIVLLLIEMWLPDHPEDDE
jgi:hypothetical protein